MLYTENPGNFDLIWLFIEEKLNWPVPNYIKYVLSYCGYSNGITIAAINDDDIDYCVKEVRKGNVIDYYSKKEPNIDVLEGCTKTAENFEFSRGHLRYLMDIVEMLKDHIKENGIDSFNVEEEKSHKKPINKKAQHKKPTVSKKKIKYSTGTKNNSLLLQSYRKQQPSKSNYGETPMERHMHILVSKMLKSLRKHTPESYMQVRSFLLVVRIIRVNIF